jgi:hypothetical protein
MEGVGITIGGDMHMSSMKPGEIAYYDAGELHALGCPAAKEGQMQFLSVTMPNIRQENNRSTELPKMYKQLLRPAEI